MVRFVSPLLPFRTAAPARGQKIEPTPLCYAGAPRGEPRPRAFRPCGGVHPEKGLPASAFQCCARPELLLAACLAPPGGHGRQVLDGPGQRLLLEELRVLSAQVRPLGGDPHPRSVEG